MIRVFYIFLFFAFMFSGCTSILVKNVTPSVSLQTQIDSLLAAPELSNAISGVAVYSLSTDKIIYERNAHTSLLPASNLKLFTTAAALRILGPDAHFTTQLLSHGAVKDSIFYGDLILKGGGDPTFIWVDSLSCIPQFQFFVEQLGARGIRKIKGQVVGDDTFFDDQQYGIGWSWENDPYYFQPRISALSINNNCVDFMLAGGDSIGALAAVSVIPTFPNISIINQLRTSDHTDFSIERQPGSNVFALSGSIASGAHERRTRTIYDPAECAVQLLSSTLLKNGFLCDTCQVPTGSEAVWVDSTFSIEINSPPISKIVDTINKKSDNLHAELLLKLIGKKTSGIGSSKAGAAAVLEFCRQCGIRTNHLNIVDGSGLSRKNLVTPASIVTLLKTMRSDSVFCNSLPHAAMESALNRAQWTTSPNVRAKTGTLDYVKALSGYITTISGEELAFSFIINHHLVETEKIIYIQNRFCQILAQP